MKKISHLLSLLFLVCISLNSFAQFGDGYIIGLAPPANLYKQKTYVVQTGNGVFDAKMKAVMEKAWKYMKPEYITLAEFQAKEKKKENMIYLRVTPYGYASVSYRVFEIGSHTHDKSSPDNVHYTFGLDYTKYSDGKESGSDVSLEYFATKLHTIITSFSLHADKYLELGSHKYDALIAFKQDAKPLATKILLVDKELFVNSDYTEGTFKASYKGKYEIVDGTKAEELSSSVDKDKYARLFVFSYPLKWCVLIIDVSTGEVYGRKEDQVGNAAQSKKRLGDAEFGRAIEKISKKIE